ncbi:hypothetical protein F4821DRAFT_281426 [Hypoxylon rubiginosum]|uniref:Uncharacterized protein n=1 Tax=Hypoxylon rubiginosum TaxID=110542 RepID=A0ACC0CR46_9PEZI|nr:hypothetical protein F4821DRAFT_281426 [Hypoxylon rubiginosum]
MAEIDPFILQIFGPPPPGLDVFETKQKINYIIIAVSIVLAALAVLGRCVSRRISGANLGADDCVIMIAFILAVLSAAIGTMSVQSGGGIHIWALSRAKIMRGLKLGYVYAFAWSVTVSVTKISIILFYRRTFTVHNRTFKYWLHILAFLAVGQFIAVIISYCTLCMPLYLYWEQFSPNPPQGTCNDDGLILLVTSITNGVINIAILITPIPPILKLNMTNKKKAGVCAIMLLGCLVCVAAFVRIRYLVDYWKAIDKTWVSADTAAWSSIELSFGIISACLPVVPPIYLRLRDQYRTFSYSRKAQPINASDHSYFDSGSNVNRWADPPVSRIHGGSSWAMNRQLQRDDEIQLTSFVTTGSPPLDHLHPDAIYVHSEVKQSRAYV